MRENLRRETIEGMRHILVAVTLVACGPAATVTQGSPVTLDTRVEGFYCNALSQCWTTEPECPRCARIERAWCGVYHTDEDTYPERLMCGVSRHACLDLLRDVRRQHGECVQRMAAR